MKQVKSSLVCMSGGAKGADAEWCKHLSPQYPFTVYSFPGFTPYRYPNVTYHECTLEELKEADEALAGAARSLGKFLPSSISVGRKYLQRDYHIVKDADAVFAVGPRDPVLKGLGVKGGTGWGCQLYWNKGGRNLFLFDEDEWLTYDEDKGWIPCPTLPSIEEYTKVACIGARELTKNGRDAIHKLK